MSGRAIDAYVAQVRAYDEQRARVLGQRPADDVWTGPLARRFRQDPHRELDPVLAAIASHLRPTDVLLDVGGGAGRFGLPLALRCRQVINVDPSAGMRAEFEEVAAEAGIKNARYIQSDWLDADGIEGDVSLVSHVTYFVVDIKRFIEKLQAATRRRVLIHIHTVPPPNVFASAYGFVHGEAPALVPGYRELLPALWEMGILPDVQVTGPLRGEAAGPTAPAPTKEQAIEGALLGPWLRGADRERARSIIEEHFDELFLPYEGGGFRRAFPQEPRGLIITWETTQAR